MKANLIRKNNGEKPKKMKIIIYWLLIAGLLFSMVGCSKDENTNVDDFTINTIEREALSPEFSLISESLALVVRHYIYTQLLLEEFMTLDIENESGLDLDDKSDAILQAMEEDDQLSTKLLKMIEEAEKNLETAAVTNYKFASGKQSLLKGIFTPVFAKGGRQIDPQTWAENLSKQYDDLRGAQKYKQLAEQLNTDAKTAYSQMQLAAKIIQDASAVEEANAVIDAWTKSTNILQVYKTTAKVSLFAASTVASGGGSLSALAASKVSLNAAGSLMIAGTDCIIDIGTTTSNIVLGENNKVTMQFEDLKDKYATFSFIAGLLSPSESFAGETIAFVGDSLVDLFYDNKIIGIKLKADIDKKVKVTSQVIDISDLNEDQAKVEIEKAGFNLPLESSQTLEQLIADYSKEVENIINQVDDLVIELAKILKNDPKKESDISIFGVYTLYTTSSLEDEIFESKVSLIDLGNNKVYWKPLDEEEEAEDEKLILDYNPQDQSLYYQEETSEFFIEFDFDTDPISGEGYVKLSLFGSEVLEEMTLIKD